MNYTDARTALYEATLRHNNTLAAYTEVRDQIAHEMRGTKAALSEAQKFELKQTMDDLHFDLTVDLHEAEVLKANAQYQFDLADNDEKNARRELDAATADKWMTISERRLESERIALHVAEMQHATVLLYKAIADDAHAREHQQSDQILADFQYKVTEEV